MGKYHRVCGWLQPRRLLLRSWLKKYGQGCDMKRSGYCESVTDPGWESGIWRAVFGKMESR